MQDSTAENDANVSQYEEIQGHVQILNAKLMNMSSSNSAMSNAIEDFNDYWERAVQLRQMRITTLEEILKERDASDKLFWQKAQRFAFSIGCTALFTMFLIDPSLFFYVVYHFGSYAIVAIATFLAAQKFHSQ